MKINDMFPSIFCINLDDRPDRWELAQKEIGKLGADFQRFPAVKKENGAEGCYFSHLSLLQKFSGKMQHVMIFEDDVEFVQEDTMSLLESALLELMTKDWALLYLGGNILRPAFKVADHLARLSHCQSTYAYCINYNYIPQVVDAIVKNKVTIDVLYADGIVPNLPCYITVPMLAIQRADYSDIEKRQMNYDIPLARYNHFLVEG